MIIPTAKELGALIRGSREALHLTQAALGEKAGVSRHSILRIERGEPSSIAALLRATAALGLVLDVRPRGAVLRDAAESVDIDAIISAARASR